MFRRCFFGETLRVLNDLLERIFVQRQETRYLGGRPCIKCHDTRVMYRYCCAKIRVVDVSVEVIAQNTSYRSASLREICGLASRLLVIEDSSNVKETTPPITTLGYQFPISEERNH